MSISLVSCVVNYSNKLAIGRNNGLLFRLKDDLKNFQILTSSVSYKDSLLDKNVVLMGRKTWFSIPRDRRPLKGRINLILTNDKDLHKISPYPNVFNRNKFDKSFYFVNFEQFIDFYKRTNANVYVIGGGEVYNKFLNMSDILLKPTKVYMTEVYNCKFEKGMEPDAFMEHLSEEYKLVGVSDKKFDVGYKVNYRFLEYRYIYNYKTDETKYNELLKDVLYNGSERIDRTGVGTLSKFGYQYKMDISQSVPLLTTKKVPWKHCIEELLWFMRGDTDAKILQKRGVKIWDGNTSREFLDKRGLGHYKEGVLGAGYGWQWRFFGGNYSQAFSDTSVIDRKKVGGFDQLEYVVDLLKNDPFSRRIMMSYWNPPDFEKTALLPCHYSVQFYVEEDIYKQKHLSCHFTMRSNDLFLGHPFNIFSYAVMTYILAAKTNMKPKELVFTGGDVHIYKNHLEQVNEQLDRKSRSLPKLLLNPNLKYKDFSDMMIDDFEIVGYFPHGVIKAPMAV
jgi:thymidylate synthase|uniref:thymidylate synthase n=1 Tax=viral metagenome TaxID=1070528 RepID=A0A6C0DVQ5_9ZZZZ